MFLLTKLLVFILVFSVLIVIREGFNFIISLVSNGRVSYNPGTTRLIVLGCAISYIFTIIFTGFRLL